MIGISKLYCGGVEPSDVLRYGAKSGRLPSHLLQFSSDKRPVVSLERYQKVQPQMCALLFKFSEHKIQ